MELPNSELSFFGVFLWLRQYTYEDFRCSSNPAIYGIFGKRFATFYAASNSFRENMKSTSLPPVLIDGHASVLQRGETSGDVGYLHKSHVLECLRRQCRSAAGAAV